MNKNYETELPEGYKKVFCVDAASKKMGLIMNLAALVIMAVVVCIAYIAIRPTGFFDNYSIPRNLIFIVALLVYIVLHELTHGAAYKLLTGRKLTFGITMAAAYCGVPDIYVYRRTALISLLAPFVVFSVVFLLPAVLLTDPWDRMYSALMLAMHLGGCAGDLYDTFLYLFRFRDPATLMRDTGPEQTFYVK